MINFLNLEYFLVVAEELNFSRAAKRLYISQQSLSNHIRKLEEHYQEPLFNRTTPLTLTPAGKCLQKDAKILLNQVKETEREINDISNFRIGELSIGASLTRSIIFLPSILAIFRQRFPNIQIHHYEDTTATLEELLRAGDIDLLLSFVPENTVNITSLPLYKEEYVAVVKPEILENCYGKRAAEIHEKLRSGFDVQLLRDCPFVVIRKGNFMGNFTQQLLENNGIPPAAILETQNVATLVAWATAGVGVSICPISYIKTLKNEIDQLYLYNLDRYNTNRVIAINYLNNRYMTQAAKEFVGIAMEVIGKQDDSLM